MKKKPLQAVMPIGLELVLIYPCPFCERKVPLVAPIKAEMGKCDNCSQHFPLVPMDETTVQFMKRITANGKASIDPQYL